MSMINSKLLESAIQYGDEQKIKESKRKKYKKKEFHVTKITCISGGLK